MKRKGLYFLIALALGGVGAVHAQDAAPAPADSAPSMSSSSYDDRWYIAPTIGGYYNDTDRNTNSRQIYYGLGVGRFISPNASIDIFADRTKRDVDSAETALVRTQRALGDARNRVAQATQRLQQKKAADAKDANKPNNKNKGK